jgi:hypothetical protein
MRFCANDPKFGKLFVTDRNASFVLPWVERCAYRQSGLGRCTCDEIDDDLLRGKRATAPVLGDETEQPVLDLVPFAGARRKVTDVQGNVQFVGLQALEPSEVVLGLPLTRPLTRPSADLSRKGRGGNGSRPEGVHELLRWISFRTCFVPRTGTITAFRGSPAPRYSGTAPGFRGPGARSGLSLHGACICRQPGTPWRRSPRRDCAPGPRCAAS